MGNTTKNNSLTDDMVEKIVANSLEKFREELFEELTNFKSSVLDGIERGLVINREIGESPYFSAEKNLEKELRTSAKLIGAIIEKWKGVRVSEETAIALVLDFMKLKYDHQPTEYYGTNPENYTQLEMLEHRGLETGKSPYKNVIVCARMLSELLLKNMLDESLLGKEDKELVAQLLSNKGIE